MSRKGHKAALLLLQFTQCLHKADKKAISFRRLPSTLHRDLIIAPMPFGVHSALSYEPSAKRGGKFGSVELAQTLNAPTSRRHRSSGYAAIFG